MTGHHFDSKERISGGEILRLSPVHFRGSRLFWALAAIKKTQGKLLDVGCGAGDFSEAISHYRPDLKVFGIDISKNAVNLAKKRIKKVKYEVADAQKLPFKNESFEVVTCLDLLEHVEDPNKALTEIRRVLKSEGVFHAFIPTEDNWLSLEGLLIRFGWKAKKIYGGHRHYFTANQVRRMLKRSDFKIVKWRWGDHLVHQLVEVIYFSWLWLQGKKINYTIEGYLSRAKPSLAISLLRWVKNIIAMVSFGETMALWWWPGLGAHVTCCPIKDGQKKKLC